MKKMCKQGYRWWRICAGYANQNKGDAVANMGMGIE